MDVDRRHAGNPDGRNTEHIMVKTSLERFTAATESLDHPRMIITEELTITVYDPAVPRRRGFRPTTTAEAVLITVSHPLSRDPRMVHAFVTVQALFDAVSGAYITGATHANGPRGRHPEDVTSMSDRTPSQPFGWRGATLQAVLERLATWQVVADLL
jgi:hypothetical protein